MKTYASGAVSALAAGHVLAVQAVRIGTSTPFRVWGGAGSLTLNSETYVGIGDAGLVSVMGAQLGGTEDSISLSLSGVDPTATGVLDGLDSARGASALIWRLLFDPSGELLLDATIWERGRVDAIQMKDIPGGTSTIACTIETAARGLGRQTGRITSDADQRLILSTDASLSRVSLAADVSLAWGGKPPARASSVLTGGFIDPIVGYVAF